MAPAVALSVFDGDTTPDCAPCPAEDSTPIAAPATGGTMAVADAINVPSPLAPPDRAPLTPEAAPPSEPPATCSAWPSMPAVVPAMPSSGAIMAPAPAPVPEPIALAEAEGAAACVGEDQLARLAAVGLELEERLGGPQDIEWAIQGGEIFVLQSRPVTA